VSKTVTPTPEELDRLPEELDRLFEEEFEEESKSDPTEAAKDKGESDKKKPKYQKRELAELRSNLFERGSSFKPTRKAEIVGIDNVLAEIDKVIFWLRNSVEFQSYKARLEPGVIFEGDPGTGKTLVSRYIATESNALFINIRDFAHNGPLYKDSDIRDLFRRARATYALTGRPIVLFWDEFENGAAERANASAEQAATVSQLTAELDGVHGKNEGVLLIGCTNYIYGIDKALRRSGRMGLQIEFCAPDRKGKKLLLDYYVRSYPRKGKIDVETLSYFLSERDTAASIEEACMEAWRVAVEKMIRSGTKSKPKLTQQDLIDVFLKRLVGPPTAFIDLPKEDRERVAVHETGHALMALVFNIPLRLITVQPGKKALGKVLTYQVKEHIGTFDEIVSDMRVTVGSICAERVAGLPQGIGATSDIDMVNQMAVQLVDDLHGGEHTGLYRPFSVGNERRSGGEGAFPNVSDRAVEQSDLDVQTYLKRVESDGDKAMAKIGEENIWEIAREVNERITLTGIEFEALFKKITGQNPSYYTPSDCIMAA
jgi:cell division protease FtsH